MMRLQTTEAENLRQSEMTHAIGFAVAFVFVTLGAILLFAALALVLQAPQDVLKWGLVIISALGGFIIAGSLLTGLWRGRGHISWIMYQFNEWNALQQKAERVKLILALMPAPMPVTLEQTTIAYNSVGMKSPQTILGFDERDLESLCLAFALGAKWSEAALLDKPLPVTKEILTKTRYYELIDSVFVPSGIITTRGGPGNKTGKLTTDDVDLMMQKIRALKPPPPLQETTPNKQGSAG